MVKTCGRCDKNFDKFKLLSVINVDGYYFMKKLNLVYLRKSKIHYWGWNVTYKSKGSNICVEVKPNVNAIYNDKLSLNININFFIFIIIIIFINIIIFSFFIYINLCENGSSNLLTIFNDFILISVWMCLNYLYLKFIFL